MNCETPSVASRHTRQLQLLTELLTRENRNTRIKSPPSVTSSTTNLTCTDLGSNPRLCCGRPVIDHLYQSTAEILTEKCNQNYWFIEYKEHDVMVTKCVIQDCFGGRVSVRARCAETAGPGLSATGGSCSSVLRKYQ